MIDKTNNAGTMGRDEAVECPECGRKWPWESEQAVAVGLQGACIACTMKYPDGAYEESQRRYSLIAALLQAEVESLRAEVERLTFEMGCLQHQYDERTAYMIVHRGAWLACSDAVRSAYSDEHHRAERLAELLDQAYGYVPAGTLADQIHCALVRY